MLSNRKDCQLKRLLNCMYCIEVCLLVLALIAAL
jgi:hypothetical protein